MVRNKFGRWIVLTTLALLRKVISAKRCIAKRSCFAGYRAMHSLKSLRCMVRFPARLTIQASVVGKVNGNVREIT